MNSSRVITHGGATLNLASIKCFKLQSNIDLGKTNVLIVEHKRRYGYIQHPETGDFEKQEYNEITEIEYADYKTASVYLNEWEDIWQEYLDDQE